MRACSRMTNSMHLVLDDIIAERRAQHRKWGEQNHTWGDWKLILDEEDGEVSKEMVENTFSSDPYHRIPELRTELVQLAAVAVAIIEYIDRTYPSELFSDMGQEGTEIRNDA